MLIPVQIRPYLIPFFFKELEGTEARYLNKKVKAVNITGVSSLGSIIRLLLVRADLPQPIDKVSIFLHMQESLKKEYRGTLFKVHSGKTNFLKVPEEVAKIINDLLEDYFRISFIYYLEGYKKANPNAKIRPGIEDFMEEYELYEFGFNVNMLRTLYYREKNKNTKLSRIQYKVPPRIGVF